MKKTLTIIFFVVLGAICFTSCTTTTPITIHGQPGEKVLIHGTSQMRSQRLETETGQKIKMADDFPFTAFALSEKPNDTTEVYIPFALNYKKRDVTLLWITGILGLYPTGSIWTWVAFYRGQQPAYKERYKYLSYQRTNSDLTFTHPVITYLDPPNSRSTQPSQDNLSVNEDAAPSEKSTRQVGEKSTRTLSDYAKSVAGTYNGKGSLTLNGELIESYSSIKVIINRVDNKTVSVNVVESGESFFAKPSEYNVIKQANGSYKLTNKTVPSAEIIIDSKKAIHYTHPRINIDGGIYQLQITQ